MWGSVGWLADPCTEILQLVKHFSAETAFHQDLLCLF